jgi:hypothetical protein
LVIAGLIPLWDVAFAKNDWRAVLRRALPFYAAIASALGILFVARYLVFRPLSWGEFPFVDNPLIAAGFVTARLTAMKVIGMQLALLVLPLHLSCDRSYDQIPVAIDPAAWVSLLVVLAVLAAVIVRRWRDPLLFWAAGFFGIALLAYRTYARNPDWTSELTLAQADVQTAPRSFKLHEMVAHALNQENAKGNIDRVIRHEEMAWEILQPVPARWSYQYVPVNLGGYYIVKGDVAGGAATAEGRGWYQKAVTVLEEGRLTRKSADMTRRSKHFAPALV